MQRPLLFLIPAVLLGIGASLLHERPPEARLQDAALELQQRITGASIALDAEALSCLRSANGPDSAKLWREDRKLGTDDIRISRGGILKMWTGNAPINEADLDSSAAAHLVLPDGTYLHGFAAAGRYRVDVLRRVWFDPPFENHYLRKHFDTGFTVADGIMAEHTQGPGPVVHDAQGMEMLRLYWTDGTATPGTRSLMALFLVFAAVAFAIAAGWQFAFARSGPWGATAWFVLPLLGARAATLIHGPLDALSGYPLFDPSLFAASFFMPSLGDLLINAVLLLGMALFIRRALRDAVPPARPWPAAIGAMAFLLLCAEGINGTMTALVRDSSVSLDLFHVQDLDAYSLLALIGIAILLFAWCAFADAMLSLLTPGRPTRRMLLLPFAATLPFIGIHHLTSNYDLILGLWPLPVLVLVGVLRRRPVTLPTLALVAVLALFTAHVLNRQTLKRTELERTAMAETATTREDPVVELLFGEATTELQADPHVAAWLRGKRPCSPADLDRLVRQPVFSGYWDRYDLRLHLISADSTHYCSTSPDAPASAVPVLDRFEQGVPVAADRDLRITDRPGEPALYIGRVPLHGASLLVEVRPRLVSDGLGFPDLLLAGIPGAQHRSDRFVRARYERSVLVSSSGDHVFPVTWKWSVPHGGMRYVVDDHDFLAQGDPKGTVVVLGTRVPSLLDHVTTFSYLFLFFCIVAALVGIIHRMVRPGPFLAPDLRGKVRLGIMAFAVISLALFTLGMRRMLDTRSDQRTERMLNDRSRGVVAELRQSLQGGSILAPAISTWLDHLLGNLSNVFLTDITLYAPDGRLLATSREQVFSTGLLPPRMDPTAFRRLAIDGDGSYIQSEHIGTAAFSTAYMSYRNDRGEVLAYLALPYFARQGEMDQERAAGYVAMVNLFTLLFLMSVVAAALITNWTTRPLQLLQRGLEHIALGSRNEPIAYLGNDELGELVQVYNRKVEELRVSAEKLARSERESAWREMAQQVAHEVKNPLTPMKLNIQQFQRTWTPELPDAKERLEALSNALVQQIDALGRIADEFSNFAQMPSAREVDLDLCATAKAAVALFAAAPNATVSYHGAGPLMVYADRERLLRTFTNLVKNALQSIPDERQGKVDVHVERHGHEVIMEIRDNGAGIPAELRDRIFTPSFTTKSSGMGLGLAMVRRMMEEAGGRVWFTTSTADEGTRDEGTSFFVALPLVGKI